MLGLGFTVRTVAFLPPSALLWDFLSSPIPPPGFSHSPRGLPPVLCCAVVRCVVLC